VTVQGQGSSAPGPFDPGLQPERTELAWRRTALAIAVGSLVSLRIFPLVLPPVAVAWGFVPGGLGLIAACALWFAARRRQLRVTAALRSAQDGSGAVAAPGGGLMLALTTLATGFGVLSIAIVAIAALFPGGR
jgi:putative membrane protein